MTLDLVLPVSLGRMDSRKLCRFLNVTLLVLFVYLVSPGAGAGSSREVNVVQLDSYSLDNASVVQVAVDVSDFELDDCCTNNGSYCRRFGSHCQCQQDDSGCRCICPSALDYTVRLAAGIAIVLLIGVSTMLAISLYRRAVLSRRNSRNGSARDRSESSASSGESSVQDSPPRYSEVFAISRADGQETDFDKLPTYEEALQRLQSMMQDPRVSISVLSTIENETSVSSAKTEEDKAENEQTAPPAVESQSSAENVTNDVTTNVTSVSTKKSRTPDGDAVVEGDLQGRENEIVGDAQLPHREEPEDEHSAL